MAVAQSGTVNTVAQPTMVNNLGSSFFGTPVGQKAGGLVQPFTAPAPQQSAGAALGTGVKTAVTALNTNTTTPSLTGAFNTTPATSGNVLGTGGTSYAAPQPAASTYAPSLYTQQNASIPYVNPNQGLVNPQALAPAPTQNNAITPAPVATTQQNAPSTQAPATTQPSTDPTFDSAVGTVQQQGSQPSAIQQQSSAEAQAAFDQYNQINTELEQSRTNEANAIAGIKGQPIPLEFQQGQSQVLQGQYLDQQNALAQQAQGATALFSPALGAATTAQGQQFGAAQSAAGLEQPSATAFGQGSYNPLTGQIESGGSQFGSGPAAAANVQSIKDQTQTVNDYSAARQSASNIVQNQLTPLLKNSGINPSDLNAVNSFIQSISKQTSSPQYQTFKNVVADLASVYAQILTPAGGSTTDLQTQIATNLINSTSQGGSIMSVIQNLDQQSQSKIDGLQKNIQNLNTNQNPNQGTSTNTPASTSNTNFNY